MGQGTFATFLSWLKNAVDLFPDDRTGENSTFTMNDAAMSAFSVFHMQCRSFLEHQRWRDENTGTHNVLSLYGAQNIPSDIHIRRMLDVVSPANLFPVYLDAVTWLKQKHRDFLDTMQNIENTFLVALDGTGFYSSSAIHCDKCSIKEHKNGQITFSHSAITPAIVNPFKPHVIPLPQEFIVPQDGHEKQDCENAAAKRWIKKYGNLFGDWGITILGDDLYSREPICELFLDQKCHFILTCKESSHPYLCEWVKSAEIGVDITETVLKHWNGTCREYYTYRFMNNVPIKEGKDVLSVNWVELIISEKSGEIKKRFSYITDFFITKDNVTRIVDSGRGRWKIENENNNILKTKGYHIEHNFGHGKENLANFLLSLNILAFLCHTLQHLFDKRYAVLRDRLSRRRRFFTGIIELTTYITFDGWDHLLLFMLKGLDIEDPGG